MAKNIPGLLKTIRTLIDKADRRGDDAQVAQYRQEIAQLERELRNPPAFVPYQDRDRPRYGDRDRDPMPQFDYNDRPRRQYQQ